MKPTQRSRHHILPRNRGGRNRRNIVVLPGPFHANFHHLFQSLTLEEVHIFLDEVMQPGKEWTYHDLSELRKRISDGRST